jgi:hypothetical protein
MDCECHKAKGKSVIFSVADRITALVVCSLQWFPNLSAVFTL